MTADEIYRIAQELSARGAAFAVATVIEIQGSGSAKPGAKVLIDADGQIISGWIGGGCVESTVRQEALESLKDRQTRIIELDLTDEVFGVGMPCGGAMKVYIEPVLPRPELVIAGHGRISEVLAQFAQVLGYSVTIADPAATPEAYPHADRVQTTGLSSAEVVINPDASVVVATHHKGDHLSIKKALDSNAGYIALVASRTRSEIIFQYVEAAGVSKETLANGRIRTPAGLDIGAQTPEEIALSIMAEIVALRRGRSGRPLVESKGAATASAASPKQETSCVGG